MKSLSFLRSLGLFAGALAFVGASAAMAADDASHHGKTIKAAKGTTAISVLVPAANSKVTGTVRFTQESDGVRVQAEVKGLSPGAHGFHVHEKGDLSKSDFTSAGGHFNPAGHPHAARDSEERHIGDLGNLEAGANGTARVDFVDEQLQLAGPHSIIGRAVIVHEKADDLKSQPTGDAGGRIAGGVIGIVEQKKK